MIKLLKNIINDHPDTRETLETTELILNSLKKKITDVVKPEIRPHYPKLLFKYKIFIQIYLHRCIDLAESTILSLSNKKILSVFLILRSLLETVAVLHDSAKNTEKYCKEKNFEKLNEIAEKAVFSTRIPEFQPYKATNILTTIEKWDKENSGILKTYEALCEFTHPNHFGTMSSYGDFLDEFTFKLSFANNYNKNSVEGATLHLTTILANALVELSTIHKLLNKIAEIAIEYQNQIEGKK